MEAEKQWIGYQPFKRELEALRQPAYIVVQEPSREASAIQTVLEEISVQRRKESLWYYSLRRFTEPGGRRVIALSGETALRWELSLEEWEKHLWEGTDLADQLEKDCLEELAVELLERLREEWPELVAFHTELTEYILKEREQWKEPAERPKFFRRALPQRLNQTLCPVIQCSDLETLEGSEDEETGWQPGSLERALGGYLLVDARMLYRCPKVWHRLKEGMIQGRLEGFTTLPFEMQILLYGPADLYVFWEQEDEDFSSLFQEVRRFPSRVPNSLPNREIWFTYVRDELQQLITDQALEFLVSLLSGLSFQELAASEGFLPGRLSLADPWIQEFQWVCAEKDQALVNIALVKEVWQNRQRRSQELQQALRNYEIPWQGQQVGSVYSLALHNLGYCHLVQPVHIAAQKKKERARRKKDQIEITLESQWPVAEETSGVPAAITYAVLSAMEGLPVHQSIAVIGNMDGEGNFQPLAGAAELIAGFYELCRQQGCEHGGVLFPAANALDLDIPPEVLTAVREERFFLYPVRTVVEGIEILMNLESDRVIRRVGKKIK